ncbi:serine/threonine-protein phosphatase 6 regulatory ankyrin repeat subunit B-like [Papaver somniferum]|uniref:serine/threonine-protein phosphatase 6 regulatory ankyrin repeat subunit B-like n=1 Tax=Papaver somniferum TaxID=3469 RepID=UPI000E704998|nr:serine/threonine-protein phosphatase 6 regulatory ankyrin repeat subunit B-like [Papaver somniferum]
MNPRQRTQLLSAAYDGKLEQLKRFASELDEVTGDGISTILGNTKDGNGRRAIHHAASGGKLDVLKYLIEEIKLDVDVKDGRGETPLSWAAIEGCVAAVEYLLQMGVNPEIRNERNMNSLHHAAMQGHKDIIPLLLSKGINVDDTDDFGSALQYAAGGDKHDTLKVLLDHGANPNLVFHETFTPLQASIEGLSWRCAEQLLKAGADPNGGPDGVRALLLAAELGATTEIIEEMVDAGAADPKFKNLNFLTGATQIVKLLVEAGADPNVTNSRGLKPVEIAAANGNRRGVEILFPVTSPMPSYIDWSINGIMKRVNSEKFQKKLMTSKAKQHFLEAKSKGTSAFERKEYWLAVYWYTEALNIKSGDAAVLSNRSLCYVCLNKGDLAFEDARQCTLERPDWPKAFYRAGEALKLLNRLDDAADAFFNGLKLDPKNKELEDAFREVTLDRLKAMNVPL